MPIATRWQDWTSFALGTWLAVSPWLCGYHEQFAPTASAAVCGVALALAAHFGASCCEDSVEWLNLCLGVWLLAAPFVLGFKAFSLPGINSIAAGALVAVLAALAVEPGKALARRLEREFSRTKVGH